MASSPRSMWSGTISLGLLNIGVTIGKTWADEREPNLRVLCGAHNLPVDRTERCSGDSDCRLDNKVKGVQLPDGSWHAFTEAEYAAIEDATKSDALEIIDVQESFNLPLDYATGTYYVRHNAKTKGSPEALATLVQYLHKTDKALVVKWCRSARQRLAVLHTDPDGILLLRTLPFVSEHRAAGDHEKAHQAVTPQPEMVEMMGQLLDTISQEDFAWDAYQDEGLNLRSVAVAKVLDGQEVPEPEAPKDSPVPDLMAAMRASIEAQKDKGDDLKEAA